MESMRPGNHSSGLPDGQCRMIEIVFSVLWGVDECGLRVLVACICLTDRVETLQGIPRTAAFGFWCVVCAFFLLSRWISISKREMKPTENSTGVFKRIDPPHKVALQLKKVTSLLDVAATCIAAVLQMLQ